MKRAASPPEYALPVFSWDGSACLQVPRHGGCPCLQDEHPQSWALPSAAPLSTPLLRCLRRRTSLGTLSSPPAETVAEMCFIIRALITEQL